MCSLICFLIAVCVFVVAYFGLCPAPPYPPSICLQSYVHLLVFSQRGIEHDLRDVCSVCYESF